MSAERVPASPMEPSAATKERTLAWLRTVSGELSTATIKRLEETLLICRQMWGDDEGPFTGRHYALAETICSPRPLRRTPVLVGGMGEKKTLRLVAQYADATNLIVSGTEELAHKLDVLRRHCDDLGRDYDSIEKTVMGPQGDPLDDVDGFLRLAQEYADLGVQHIHLRAMAPDPAAAVTAFGERVAPRLAEIGG